MIMNRYYYLSDDEYKLLCLCDLKRFVKPVLVDPFLGKYYFLISYDSVDALARVVYARKNKSSMRYKKLVSFVDRLQDILEKNPDIC